MSESKFLPFQDANGDGLIDVCDEIVAPEVVACPECTPNPAALVPDWLTRDIYEPFLNEKLCKYQVTVTTSETTTRSPEDGDEAAAKLALDELYEESAETAILALLTVYNKDQSSTSVSAIKEVIEYTQFSLDVRPKSRLKLLYSVPKENLDALDDAEEEEEEDDAEAGDIIVTFPANELGPMMMRIRKTLRLYNRYLKTYRAVDNSNLLFLEDNSVFPLEIYGDWGGGMAKTEVMSKVLPQLDGFLNNYGYNIGNVGGLGNAGSGIWHGGDRLTEITFTFDSDYIIKKLKFFTEGCGEKPTIYTEDSGKIKKLKAESAWKDRTAMGYLISLREMDAEIQGRVAPNWIEFLKKYTYPEIYETDTVAYDSSPASCIGEALFNEGKQLGQDILDEVFSLGDALAYKFKDQICKKSLGEAMEEQASLGVIYDPNAQEDVNWYTMAQMQAFQTLEADEQVFMTFCARVLGMGSGLGDGDAVAMLDALWSEGFDDFKLCGLMSFLTEAINCLMGGLTLEEALTPIVESALAGMQINNFGDLFIGLPPEKQIELDELVKKNLESGNIFKDDSSLQAFSDSLAPSGGEGGDAVGEMDNAWQIVKPWEDDNLSESERWMDSTGMTSAELQDPTKETRTLAQQFDVGSEENRNQLSSSIVMQAYVKALLEVYQDNLLELVDEINKFPGAQMIANLLAFIDCPRPAFFNPSVMDFIKDIELPFCREMSDINFPRLVNPFGWFPKWVDIVQAIQVAFMAALQQLVITIIMKLIVKVCELIGNALCKALEMAGDLLEALATPGDCTQFSDMVREALCGENATDDAVNDTMVDMIGTLGVGAAAWADHDQTLAFAEDIGCSVTRKELADAMLGEMSNDMAAALVSLVENEYPDFQEALPHEEAVKSMMKGCGNLLPADFKDGLRDFVNQLPENDVMPAHPSLCATPEQLEDFCALRAELLSDRASPEQIAEMCDNLRETAKEDLGDLWRAANDFEGYIEDNMPPIISDPGCDNGLIPFEPDEAIATVTAALGNQMEQLKVDYGTDMIGNGPGEKNWGLVNMILSDTLGQPLTVHNRKASNKNKVMDFYTGLTGSSGAVSLDTILGYTAFLSPMAALMSLMYGDPEPEKQRGAFPTSVAKWLQDDIMDKAGYMYDSGSWDERRFGTYISSDTADVITASINNEWQADEEWNMSMDDLGFTGIFGRDLDLLSIPDLGYNIELESQFDPDNDKASGVKFIEKGRKALPDLAITFKDNAKGLASVPVGEYPTGSKEPEASSTWSYGYAVEAFLGDMIEDDEGNIVNRPDDNIRIKITDLYNTAAKLDDAANDMVSLEVNEDGSPGDNFGESIWTNLIKEDKVIPNLKYEFLSVDDTLLDVVMSPKLKTINTSPVDSTGKGDAFNLLDMYPNFLQTFQAQSAYTPQTVLLKEMINRTNGTSLSDTAAETFINDSIQTMSRLIFQEIGNNSGSWDYGAQYDMLSEADVEYGIYDLEMGTDENYPGWVPYADYEVDDGEGGTRELRNRDMKLGISFDQYKNEYVNETPDETRVFYLDPMTFGGNYMNPPIYIKPLASEGWLGMVDVLFPELSPCKPQTSDLVDFGNIQEIIDEIYPYIPEDERLKSDPDCIIERPYNRILMRSAKAGLVGLITAACRIYASTHMIKALPAFTTFSPRFPDTYSSAFASYIVENMETSFKDAGGGPEWVNAVFSDTEFWYAFLEQSVQLYAAMVDEGTVEAPPTVLEALFRINDMQEEYEYPDKEDLKAAKDTREASRLQTLKSYRQDINLEAIRETEEDAKLVLKEWVLEQLKYMSEKFMANMERFNMAPVVNNIDYYIMDNLCGIDGGLYVDSAVKPDGTVAASYVDLPTIPIEEDTAEEYHDAEAVAYYTAGGELVVGEDLDEEGLGVGEEYIGYYHVVIDENGNPSWMAGEYHSDEEMHDVLHPLVNQIIVEIGDIPELDVGSYGSENQLFTLEKYISIDGVRYAPTAATTIVKGYSDLSVNLSEVYPGTMKTVRDDNGREVGIEGVLGVRYGVQFSAFIDGTPYEITAVEVDALDLPLSKFSNLNADSKLLLCLLNLLKEDEKFKLVTRYIVPFNKLTSIAAIYTDMGLLPSIGEVTVAKGGTYESVFPWTEAAGNYMEGVNKPGLAATVTLGEVTVDEETESVVENVSLDAASAEVVGAWSSKKDRNVVSLFWLEFDAWDQVLLRNSSGRIKKLFRSYYNSRDFNPDDIGKGIRGGPGQLFFNKMRGLLKPAPGKRLLPRWRRRRLRSNPFNANGELCEKES